MKLFLLIAVFVAVVYATNFKCDPPCSSGLTCVGNPCQAAPCFGVCTIPKTTSKATVTATTIHKVTKKTKPPAFGEFFVLDICLHASSLRSALSSQSNMRRKSVSGDSLLRCLYSVLKLV
ncbi:hypothetical protein L596_012082 [Steinernema carpocapsae]|uniref:WAP domain-containing protein n=1 Tax=Steinernema carpocapsae TaxID=34508 RepID=A0A4U5NVZ3_STECR|nr:hypothetical protein L596_012082 [Steinernema carpocapsae]